MNITESLHHHAGVEVEILLGHILHKPKEFLYTHPDKNLTTAQEKKLRELIRRRKKGEPIAYLLGYKDFYGLRFTVTKDTLIPRPETEWVVEHILHSGMNANSRVLDLGTGSGCIGVSIKKYAPKMRVTAADVSEKALAVAKTNARLHKTSLQFVKSNLLSNLQRTPFDTIVANLPYGWGAWKNNSSQESKAIRFEPKLALFTKEEGLYLYRLLLEQINELPHKPHTVFLEFDPRQKKKLAKLIKDTLPKSKRTFHKDLAGLWRYVEITLS